MPYTRPLVSVFLAALGGLSPSLIAAATAAQPPGSSTGSTRSSSLVCLRAPGSEMILVPRTTFRMGSRRAEVRAAWDACKREPSGAQCTEAMFADEMSEHWVTLSSYWLDRREVTVGEYRRCVEAGVCTTLPYEYVTAPPARDDLPVVHVTWHEAHAFCAFVGKRLPTEAEWERAARGENGRRFPWGEHMSWFRSNHGKYDRDPLDASDGFAELAPVGSFPSGRTPDGFEDLSGNAAEWTSDSYEDGYAAASVEDPPGPAPNLAKVVRGGSYAAGLPWLRGASRSFEPADRRSPHVGFRCARDAGLRVPRVPHAAWPPASLVP